ncbi:hypothetical protein CPB86DRAFT_716840, partial [Serendipita vermifera]
LAGLTAKYPKYSGTLIQTHSDLAFSQRWRNVIAVDLHVAKRPALLGVRNEEESDVASIVVPFQPTEAVTMVLIQDIFNSMDPKILKLREDDLGYWSSEATEIAWHDTHFYVAVIAPDSSQVYYKVGRGIIKPQM